MLGALKLPAVAVMGFCLGGRYAVLLAGKDKRLVACVPYYPSIRVPIQAERDAGRAGAGGARSPARSTSSTAPADKVFLQPVFETLRDILEQRRVATMVQVHPGAVHSFMRPDLHVDPGQRDRPPGCRGRRWWRSWKPACRG